MVQREATDIERLKEQAGEFFTKTRSVKCPAFPNEVISFNGKGLLHLFYSGSRSERSESEVSARIKLLGRAVKLLQLMPIPQEESQRTDQNGKVFKYWAFEGVVDEFRLKVIVRQKGHGKKHFWSVVPAWRKTRFGRQNSRSDLSRL